MAVLYSQHFAQFFDDNGDPLSGGKLYTYAAGTSTPKATYTDAGGATPNANPIILDSAGRATLFLNGAYKFTLKTSADVPVTNGETDNVTAFSTQASSVDSITTSFTEDVITASDSVIFSDASDSGNTKRDTVQGIIDLVGGSISSCLAYKTGNQSIPNATATALSWDGEGFDTSSWHDNATNNTRFTVPNGITRARVNVAFQAGSGSYNSLLYLRKNGSSICFIGTQEVGAYKFFQFPLVNVAAGDYLEVYYHQDSGSSQTLNAGVAWGSGVATAWCQVEGF